MATAAAQIISGRRYREGVMHVTLTGRIPGPGRITLKEQTNTVRRSHTLNPHTGADAVTACRVRRRQNEEG